MKENKFYYMYEILASKQIRKLIESQIEKS